MKSTKHVTSLGDIFWRNENNKLHREEYPAIEWDNGTKWWYINGQIHREDGPAIERPIGNNGWFLNDIQYSEEQYKHEMVKHNLKKLKV